jgi:hypothetical protein
MLLKNKKTMGGLRLMRSKSVFHTAVDYPNNYGSRSKQLFPQHDSVAAKLMDSKLQLCTKQILQLPRAQWVLYLSQLCRTCRSRVNECSKRSRMGNPEEVGFVYVSIKREYKICLA